MGGRGRKESGEQGGKRHRLRGVFSVMERSHGGVKGKHFLDDGKTEEYCQLQQRLMQIRASGEGKRMAEGESRWSALKKTAACCTGRMRRGGKR